MLERSNLFVVALDDRRRWYRYHHLFGDVLRARLDHEHPDRVADLHRRASAWFEAAGDRPEAIRHAATAEDYAKAAELVELGIPDLRQARQDATQRSGSTPCPRRCSRTVRCSTSASVGARMVVGDMAGVEALLDEHRSLARTGPTRRRAGRPRPRRVRAASRRRRRCTEPRSRCSAATSPRRSTTAIVLRSLSAPDDHLGRGAAAALVGLARWADGDLESAAAQYAAAIAEFHDAEYYADILGVLPRARRHAGRPRAPRRGRARPSPPDSTSPRPTGRCAVPPTCTSGSPRSTSNATSSTPPPSISRASLGARRTAGPRPARLPVAGRRRPPPLDPRRPRRAPSSCSAKPSSATTPTTPPRRARSPPPPPASTSPRRPRRRAAVGDRGRCRSADDETSYLREYEHLTLARVLLATGRAADAVPLLQRLLVAAEAGGRRGQRHRSAGCCSPSPIRPPATLTRRSPRSTTP